MIQKEFIASELKYRYPQMTEQMVHPRQPVKRPLFFEPGEQRISARIYLCFANQVEFIPTQNSENAFFLCIGQPKNQLLSKLDYCAFPAETDQTALFNFVQRLFDRLDEWSQRLKEISETGSDCAELLEAAAGMLQNPVWLCDERWHMIARAERFYPETGMAECEYSYKMMEQNANAYQEGAPFRIAGSDQTEMLCALLAAGGARFTLICAARERPFYASDESVFEFLSGYVKLMLSERKTSVRALRPNREFDALERSLRDLISLPLPQDVSLQTLQRFGWTEESDFLVLAAEPKNGDLRENQAYAVCDSLENEIPDCCAFLMDSMIASVVSLPRGEEERVIAVLRAFANERGLRFGTSAVMSGYQFFPQRFKQARFSLDAKKESGTSITLFSDAADAYLLGCATETLPAELVCMRSVCEMAQSDREHDTNYLETAERYIKNRFNAVKTAGELYIHRSTFLYRLERIKTQFGLDLDSEQPSLLRLLYSIQLMMQEAEKGKATK
ncbi:MAG: helix-turn-helix domain-containing protein [Clostridiaceae bacterium]